jgi:ATP-dependent DNA ligase
VFNGRDLTQTPLIERKAGLEKLMRWDISPHVVYSDRFRTHGEKVLARACRGDGANGLPRQAAVVSPPQG